MWWGVCIIKLMIDLVDVYSYDYVRYTNLIIIEIKYIT
jgi:hypothetical protein